MRLLFSKSASPHHGFAAYYTYLEKIFQADAVLHFGTHGSLEFMPGKQVQSSEYRGCCFDAAPCVEESWPASLGKCPGAFKGVSFHIIALNSWTQRSQHCR